MLSFFNARYLTVTVSLRGPVLTIRSFWLGNKLWKKKVSQVLWLWSSFFLKKFYLMDGMDTTGWTGGTGSMVERKAFFWRFYFAFLGSFINLAFLSLTFFFAILNERRFLLWRFFRFFSKKVFLHIIWKIAFSRNLEGVFVWCFFWRFFVFIKKRRFFVGVFWRFYTSINAFFWQFFFGGFFLKKGVF